MIRALRITAAILAATALVSLPTTATAIGRTRAVETINLHIIFVPSAGQLNLDYSEGGDFPKALDGRPPEHQVLVQGIAVAVYKDRYGGIVTIAEDAARPGQAPICVAESLMFHCQGTLDAPGLPGRPTVIIY
ncbi:hypothetical protein [Streptacidiphilus melanogenes]|uniref:hypothetical protein n=1 Tax=Streptacidiphilus melanogenes TaxID=411235 RepID=UPI0005A65AFD|nr:hypothetical protein [Streptacidiphilus melanogenes]